MRRLFAVRFFIAVAVLCFGLPVAGQAQPKAKSTKATTGTLVMDLSQTGSSAAPKNRTSRSVTTAVLALDLSAGATAPAARRAMQTSVLTINLSSNAAAPGKSTRQFTAALLLMDLSGSGTGGATGARKLSFSTAPLAIALGDSPSAAPLKKHSSFTTSPLLMNLKP